MVVVQRLLGFSALMKFLCLWSQNSLEGWDEFMQEMQDFYQVKCSYRWQLLIPVLTALLPILFEGVPVRHKGRQLPLSVAV